ncbi:MAG TPA: tetratricopeptide repeat protein, partial [Nitrospiria bacterium]
MIRGTRRWIGIGLLLTLSGCGSFPRIIVLHDPLAPQEHLELGIRYESQRDWAAAEKEYRAALDPDPRFPPALANLGNLYAQQGQYDTARDYYRRALRYDPNHPMANNNLAMIYVTQGIHLAEAGEMIDRALAADPPHR